MKKFLLLALWMQALCLSAQNNFHVLAVKGQIQIKKGATWAALKTGATIHDKSEIKVGANSYVGLLNSATGDPLEINQAGNYTTEQLTKLLPEQKGVMTKYAEFLLSRNEETNKRGAATGSVHRGMDDPTRIYLPKENNTILQNEIKLSWESVKPKEKYAVVFTNLFDDEILKKEVQDTTVTVNLNEEVLKNQAAVLVTIKPLSGSKKQSISYLLRHVPDSKKESLNAGINVLKLKLKNPESAFSSYLMAIYYEQNNLWTDATSEWINAIQKDPSNTLYKAEFRKFLVRTKI